MEPKNVRPIHMVEFLRTCLSRRLLALNEGKTRRQFGVGSQERAEALAIFHQFTFF